ncbi:MAG: hypothetical protein QGH40_05920, partial [bacterium]|nr:hypothetical protein [bacterium]
IYKELEPVQKRALDPIVPIIVEKITTDAVNESGELISLIPEEHRDNLYHEYFPGYGEGDHHYRYRKGRETKREFLSSFWKTEQEVIESTEYREMVIKASLLSQLEAQVECLKVLKLFEIEINGQIVAAAKVSFQLKHSLITECRRMYANNKIWFELWRKDKLDLWGDEYELCGETYEFKEEPAGEESSITTGLLN